MRNGRDADLESVIAALAELTDTELQALIDSTYGAPQTGPGLLAWIDALERLRELVLPQGGGHCQQQVGGGDEGGGSHRAA
jgi:hypothetical protein